MYTGTYTFHGTIYSFNTNIKYNSNSKVVVIVVVLECWA